MCAQCFWAILWLIAKLKLLEIKVMHEIHHIPSLFLRLYHPPSLCMSSLNLSDHKLWSGLTKDKVHIQNNIYVSQDWTTHYVDLIILLHSKVNSITKEGGVAYEGGRGTAPLYSSRLGHFGHKGLQAYHTCDVETLPLHPSSEPADSCHPTRNLFKWFISTKNYNIRCKNPKGADSTWMGRTHYYQQKCSGNIVWISLLLFKAFSFSFQSGWKWCGYIPERSLLWTPKIQCDANLWM